jgi:protein-serine/threonine kinase
MPLQELTVLPEPQGGHEYHLGSNHTKRLTSRTQSNLRAYGDGRRACRCWYRVSGTLINISQHSLRPRSKAGAATLVERCGKCWEVAGRTKFSIAFVSCRKKDNGAGAELYAVKNVQRQPKETERMCIRRSTAEFCVLSALPNVICTLELLMDTKGDYCEVMEFCSGGDLHNLMRMVGTLKWQDTDCNIKQLMRGAEYP